MDRPCASRSIKMTRHPMRQWYYAKDASSNVLLGCDCRHLWYTLVIKNDVCFFLLPFGMCNSPRGSCLTEHIRVKTNT